MATMLRTAANERSTYPVQLTFTDADGVGVAPKTLTWTLSNGQGTIINSREGVVVATPTSTTTIVLSGADLQTTGAADEERILTLEGTYDSDDYGDDLPLTYAVAFRVVSVPEVS